MALLEICSSWSISAISRNLPIFKQQKILKKVTFRLINQTSSCKSCKAMFMNLTSPMEPNHWTSQTLPNRVGPRPNGSKEPAKFQWGTDTPKKKWVLIHAWILQLVVVFFGRNSKLKRMDSDGFWRTFGIATKSCCGTVSVAKSVSQTSKQKTSNKIHRDSYHTYTVTFTHTYTYHVFYYSIHIQYQEKNLMSPTTQSSRYPQEKQKNTKKSSATKKKTSLPCIIPWSHSPQRWHLATPGLCLHTCFLVLLAQLRLPILGSKGSKFYLITNSWKQILESFNDSKTLNVEVESGNSCVKMWFFGLTSVLFFWCDFYIQVIQSSPWFIPCLHSSNLLRAWALLHDDLFGVRLVSLISLGWIDVDECWLIKLISKTPKFLKGDQKIREKIACFPSVCISHVDTKQAKGWNKKRNYRLPPSPLFSQQSSPHTWCRAWLTGIQSPTQLQTLSRASQ